MNLYSICLSNKGTIQHYCSFSHKSKGWQSDTTASTIYRTGNVQGTFLSHPKRLVLFRTGIESHPSSLDSETERLGFISLRVLPLFCIDNAFPVVGSSSPLFHGVRKAGSCRRRANRPEDWGLYNQHEPKKEWGSSKAKQRLVLQTLRNQQDHIKKSPCRTNQQLKPTGTPCTSNV